MTSTPEFQAFPKIHRLNREVIVTEKIDGTNALVWISDDSTEARAGSRSRWITPEDDNFGFASWVRHNAEELRGLGPGYHSAALRLGANLIRKVDGSVIFRLALN